MRTEADDATRSTAADDTADTADATRMPGVQRHAAAKGTRSRALIRSGWLLLVLALAIVCLTMFGQL
ncbi:MAG: hypothetical protein AB7O97_04290 [Planctomycetota bacterium]